MADNKEYPIHLRFEGTSFKMGIRLVGDRMSFHFLHELMSECLDYGKMEDSEAENCTYIGLVSFFCYEVRHAYMGDRVVIMDGKPMREWTDVLFQLFETESERFEVGVEMSWPRMLCVMAAWWECLKHKECPPGAWAMMREFTENIERLLLSRNKSQYPSIEPFIHGAIYAGNPYLMQFMEYANLNYLYLVRMNGRTSISQLAESMKYVAYGTNAYNGYMSTLKKQAKKLDCPIAELKNNVEEWVYDVML